jgi:dipeptidyl aminopeptidase/acylaminoacyl peptidase
VPPEEFVVKAADGRTDLYGLLYKPPDFDPSKKYPVIEWIYAGPWTTVVPRRFTDYAGVEAQSLARLGAVVFVVDARGTPGRDREFQDVVVGNLGRHEIPDHVATLRQLAEEHPYMDTNRVGVFGGSWGGYFALRAMLLAPDVYHVGVAVKPARDIADYYADYIEPYMGLPKSSPEGYAYGSNTRLVQNLKGKLLLIHGTGDAEAPFSGTMKMVDALMRAGKYFDLIVVPDENHFPMRGRHAEYLREAIRRHFQKHLEL